MPLWGPAIWILMAAVEAVGFARVLKLKSASAALLAVVINGIYVALAMHFIR